MSTQRFPDAERLKGPATLEAVVAAVVKISAYDEAMVQDLVSAGRLREIFPFRPGTMETPPDFVSRDDLVKASPMPLDKTARAALIQSSMPSRTHNQDQFMEFLAEWQQSSE
jgi:hypothetical protein